jgi:UDP-N-acetyl-D-glucosamine/UDP-N-acetyl-D-galactosamine dehydrogenase
VSTASTLNERIAVIGLGYVGLPVALAFARKVPGTVGFDVNTRRIEDLRRFVDKNGEESEASLREANLEVTADTARLADFFIVAVPTPIDAQKRPDLTPLVRASETVGKAIAGCAPGAVVVFESTVYPGVTEEVCGPILEKVSGLRSAASTSSSATPRAHQPRRQGAHAREDHEGGRGRETPPSLERVAAAYAPSSRPACTAPRRSWWPRPRRSSRTPSATSTSRS